MAQLGTTIDHQAIEPGQNGFENLPAGWYTAQMIESEVVNTKSGNGIMLKCTWEIVDGEYTNRKVWDQINYQHESAQAQLIGQQRIKAICEAIGYTDHLSDSEVLHFKPCQIRLGLSKPQEGYEQRNEIKAFKPLTAAVPASKPQGAPAPAAQTTKPAAAPAAAPKASPAKPVGPTNGSRPWAQKGAA